MANDLATIERQLRPLTAGFTDLLRPTGVNAERVIRSVLVSCERNPQLMDCTPTSIIQGAWSFAVLGLEADGFSGQAFLIPFRQKGTRIAQPVVGYKGYNTLGARVGLTIDGAVVREGDEFEFELGTNAFVRHKPTLGRGDRRIIGAWAAATAPNRAPLVVVMDIDELEEIRDRSPAYRSGTETPWKDPKIGFPAMCAKTPKRRLARALPLSAYAYHMAAAMDEAHDERGLHSYLHPEKGLVIDGEAQPLTEAQPEPESPPRLDQRTAYVIRTGRGEERHTSVEQWRAEMLRIATRGTREQAARCLELNDPVMAQYAEKHPDAVRDVRAALERRRDEPPAEPTLERDTIIEPAAPPPDRARPAPRVAAEPVFAVQVVKPPGGAPDWVRTKNALIETALKLSTGEEFERFRRDSAATIAMLRAQDPASYDAFEAIATAQEKALR